MNCQGAWDNDEVSSSIWHPGGSGAGASTTMYIREEVIIHRVRVTQYRVMDVGESETAVLTAHFIVGDRICHKNDSGY